MPKAVVVMPRPSSRRWGSLRNSQPWRWVVEGAVLHLFSDPTRIGRSTDSTGREVESSVAARCSITSGSRWPLRGAGRPTLTGSRIRTTSAISCQLTSARWSSSPTHTPHGRKTGRTGPDRLPFASPPDWDWFEPALRDTVNAHLACRRHGEWPSAPVGGCISADGGVASV